MDFRLTPEQEAQKKEFEEFAQAIMKDAPPGWGTSMEVQLSEVGFEFSRKTHKRLAEKGWLVRHWPKEYGGGDAPMIEQFIYNEVMGYHRVPTGDGFGVGMIGPTLLAVGSEEQKKEHLPYIARAERYWCQGWSEPDAGSDLASLTTRAERVGDEYIVNGQKTWTSGAHHADWCFLIARTDPTQKRSRGLTYLMADMKTPGITVRPLHSMDGRHIFNEVYFDDVKIPVKNRVGDENDGWRVTRATMNFERSGVGSIAGTRRSIADMVERCKEIPWNGKTLADNPVVRNRVAELFAQAEAGRALAYKISWLQQKGEFISSPHLASAMKVFNSELAQKVATVALQIFGPFSQVKEGKRAEMGARWQSGYQSAPGSNILAGSSEVQRNIIATVGLGLPRTW